MVLTPLRDPGKTMVEPYFISQENRVKPFSKPYSCVYVNRVQTLAKCATIYTYIYIYMNSAFKEGT